MFCAILTLLFNSCNSGEKKTEPAKIDTVQTTVEKQSIDTVTAQEEIKLSQAEKNELNKYFSYFSEIYMNPFNIDAIADKDMIFFAIYHNYRHNSKIFKLSADGLKAKIKDNYIDETAMKFFGKTIGKHFASDGIAYKNNYYEIEQSGGEAFVFSQVDKFIDNGNGNFTANVNVFTASSGWTGDVNGTPGDWKKTAEGDDMPVLTGKIKATVKKVNENGNSRYILVEYKEVK